jgi:hypothetical protein
MGPSGTTGSVRHTLSRQPYGRKFRLQRLAPHGRCQITLLLCFNPLITDLCTLYCIALQERKYYKQEVLARTNRQLSFDTTRNCTENNAPNNSSSVVCALLAAGTCLPSRCLATI